MGKKYSDEELLENLKEVYVKYGYISKNTINEYGLCSDSVYFRRFGTLNNVMELIGVDIKNNKKVKNEKCFKGINKKYTKQQLIDIMINYYNNVGFPIQRKFRESNGLPSYVTYYTEFGSFKNAILVSGIDIPKERQHYFNRGSLSDKELLELLKYYTYKKLETDIYLLTNEDIDNISNMPNTGVYCSRFGGVIDAYKKIEIDYIEFNKNALEKDMLTQYKNLCKMLGYTADSRDINKASSENICYSSNAYICHFGSISNLQKLCGFIPTILGKSITKEEVIENLFKLYDELCYIPTQRDIDGCGYLPSTNSIIKMFGSIREMQNELFGETYSKVKVTNKGTVCNSSYEYIFAKMLENYNIDFTKEEYYKDYIKDFDKNYRFDYIVMIDNEKYFIEIFGITNNEKYDEKTKEKIKLCKDNNLKLIELYPSDFYGKRQKDFYLLLLDKIKESEWI